MGHLDHEVFPNESAYPTVDEIGVRELCLNCQNRISIAPIYASRFSK